MRTRVAINGLGRIGRAILKLALDEPTLEVVAINDLAEVENLAYLLRFDTVYGRYAKPVAVEEGGLAIAGRKLRTLRSRDPLELPWKELGIELVFECTGALTQRPDLEKHIHAGARFVLLSAPSRGGEVETVVHGANVAPGKPSIISCASCTTNCITPIVEVVGRRIGFRKAVMTTVHAYTPRSARVLRHRRRCACLRRRSRAHPGRRRRPGQDHELVRQRVGLCEPDAARGARPDRQSAPGMRFSGKVALVAGGTGALGRAVSLALQREGAHVIVTYRKPRALDGLRNSVEAHQVAVTDEATVSELIAKIVAQHQTLDVLVNAVGGYAGGTKLWEQEASVLDRMLAQNLRSGYALSRAAVRVMLKQGRGTIVNVAAKAAFDHPAGAAAYAASKAAALALLDSLVAELKGTGVPGELDSAEHHRYAGQPAGDAEGGLCAGGNCARDPVLVQRRGRSRAWGGGSGLRTELMPEHAEVEHAAQRREAGGEPYGGRRLHGAAEDAAERARGAHVTRGKDVEPAEAAQQHIVGGPRPDSGQLEQPCSRLRVGQRAQLMLETLERQPRQVAQLCRAARREPAAPQRRERRAGDKTGIRRTDARAVRRAGTEALGQMTEARHAGSERKLLAADAVRQRFEQRRETLRPEPRAAARELGEAALAPHAAPERLEIELERKQPRDERFDFAAVPGAGRSGVKSERRSALPASQQRRPAGENGDARPGAVFLHAIDQVARRAAQHARRQREVLDRRGPQSDAYVS